MRLCQPLRPLLSSSVLKWKVVNLVLHATEGLQHPEAFPGNFLSKMLQNLLNLVFDKWKQLCVLRKLLLADFNRG
uniref:Uncharacterized protein n=1 Tax=Anguilla anguilla TaxID=7936 RepID=A0A0E9W0V2_ANGAN